MNDRDNKNNIKKSGSISSAYGLSKVKSQRYKDDSNDSLYIYPIIKESKVQLRHAFGYPEEYVNLLFSEAAEFIAQVKVAKKYEGEMLLYRHKQDIYDKHINNLFKISEKAYHLEKIPIEDYDSELLFYYCAKSKNAHSKIEDFFCNRCEAILALSDYDRDRYVGIIESIDVLERKIATKKGEITVFDKTIKELKTSLTKEPDDLRDFIKSMIDSYEENGKKTEQIIMLLEKELDDCKSFHRDIMKKLKFYNPEFN